MTPSFLPAVVLPPVAPVAPPPSGAFELALRAEAHGEAQRVTTAVAPPREVDHATRSEAAVQRVDAVRQDQVAVVLQDSQLNRVSNVGME